MLRVKFDDPLETWVYVDVELGQVVATIHRLNRLERWLYNGLHSLDFGFWYDKRPLWDIGMIALSLGGLVIERDRALVRHEAREARLHETHAAAGSCLKNRFSCA